MSNFVALVIIAEFDVFVYASMKDEPLKQLTEREFTEKVFRIEHTTSKKATEQDLSESLDKYGEPRPLKVFFTKRECSNILQYAVYKFFRSFFVSFYFYYFPMLFMMFGVMVATFFAEMGENCNPSN